MVAGENNQPERKGTMAQEALLQPPLPIGTPLYTRKTQNAADGSGGSSRGRSNLYQEHGKAAERGVQIPGSPRDPIGSALSSREGRHDWIPVSRRLLYHADRALPSRSIHVRPEALLSLEHQDSFETAVHVTVPRYLCTQRDDA